MKIFLEGPEGIVYIHQDPLLSSSHLLAFLFTSYCFLSVSNQNILFNEDFLLNPIIFLRLLILPGTKSMRVSALPYIDENSPRRSGGHKINVSL